MNKLSKYTQDALNKILFFAPIGETEKEQTLLNDSFISLREEERALILEYLKKRKVTPALAELVVKQLMKNGLTLDGIIGPISKACLFILHRRIEKLYKEKGYTKEKNNSLNLIGVRMSHKYTNKFTDFYIFCYPNSHTITRIVPCSTKPGLYGLGNIFNPRWIMGKFGTAVMKPGQYKEAYTLQSGWWSGRPFLYQVGRVEIYRDGNKDLKIDREIKQSGFFGINHHSWKNFISNFVNNLSQGCQVFKARVLDYVVPYWRSFNGAKISYTLILHKELI